jgi:hypothetical protein
MVLSDTYSRAGTNASGISASAGRHVGPLAPGLDSLLNFCLPLLIRRLGTFNFALVRTAQFAD